MGNSTVETLNRGMQCLVDQLGIVEAERFISIIIREQFDYTIWQREHFDGISDEEMKEKIDKYINSHPYGGKAPVIL